MGGRNDRLSIAIGESFGKTLASEMGEWFENHLETWISSGRKLGSIDSYYISEQVWSTLNNGARGCRLPATGKTHTGCCRVTWFAGSFDDYSRQRTRLSDEMVAISRQSVPNDQAVESPRDYGISGRPTAIDPGEDRITMLRQAGMYIE